MLAAECVPIERQSATAPPPAVVLDGLHKRFGALEAVATLHLDILQGEVFGLLGPNGAGKTTTIRMLATLITPSGGRALVNGIELGTNNAAIRRSVGLLTEAPGLYERLTAEQNLRFFARLYDVSSREQLKRIAFYMGMLGLTERRDRAVGGYSKGMKQKVAIARALIHEPRLLLLDEPTSGLDPESAKVVRDFILDLKQSGRTIVLCTHDLDEASRLCDRVGIIRQGLVRVDSPRSLGRGVFGRRVQMSLGRGREGALVAIRGVQGWSNASLDDGVLTVDTDDPDRFNPALLRALIVAGVEVRFVTEVVPTLEDTYLELMRDGS